MLLRAHILPALLRPHCAQGLVHHVYVEQSQGRLLQFYYIPGKSFSVNHAFSPLLLPIATIAGLRMVMTSDQGASPGDLRIWTLSSTISSIT